MSEAEFIRIQKSIDKLKEKYDSEKDDIYYEILTNISNTCKYKKYLLELYKNECISGRERSFNLEAILKLLLIKEEDNKLLKKHFEGEHVDIIPFLTNGEFIEGLLKKTGLNNLPNCIAKLGGTSKTKMRSRRTKMLSRRSKMRSRRSKMRSRRSKKRSKKIP